ncbi:ABC transporter ATP-binding protein [Anoxybacterium hadale]|uniref:ABC transporter ATP-binding protein n=1 Tax=Anoxybacterium hadale TaxID=3408580 RepID=A0ACD1A6T0_9FIRM|nr:ABC transporter ATP-binding protein [Clostridiales bacterium]
MSYIIFDHISKNYGSNQVLKGIDLKIERGDFVTLLGPSGCGKSTLLRCLSGLEAVTEGRFYLDGADITEMEPKDRNVGMIFQQYSLFPNMNVFQNISFGLKLKKLPKQHIEMKVRRAIEMVELNGKEDHYPSQLSGGQQQRVALARSIAAEPKVLLLDEPLSAIDAKLRRSLQSRIREIHDELGITSIFVTHDQDEAMILSDVIHLFNQGTIEQSDRPVDLYTSPKSAYAAGFIGQYNILSREDFHAIIYNKIQDTATRGDSREESSESSHIAIRPETIELNSELPEQSDEAYYQFDAVVRDYTLHGNVLRYTISVSGITLKADVLFRSFKLFEPNSTIHAYVAKRNCLNV